MDWIVFDYAEVISHPPPEEAGDLLAEAVGVPRDRFWPAYWHDRKVYDLGTVEAATFWGGVCARLDRPLDAGLLQRLVTLDLGAWLHLNPQAMAIVEDLAAGGARLALLSNAPVEMARLIDAQEWAGLFRHRFYSADLGRAKPDPEAFRLVCARLGAQPADLLFIDDREENVSAARGLGITSLLYTGPDRLRADLAAALPGTAHPPGHPR